MTTKLKVKGALLLAPMSSSCCFLMRKKSIRGSSSGKEKMWLLLRMNDAKLLYCSFCCAELCTKSPSPIHGVRFLLFVFRLLFSRSFLVLDL